MLLSDAPISGGTEPASRLHLCFSHTIKRSVVYVVRRESREQSLPLHFANDEAVVLGVVLALRHDLDRALL